MNSVAAHRVHVSMVPVTTEDAQHGSAHNVEFATAAITGLAQRASRE
jgi:hypothetical protein